MDKDINASPFNAISPLVVALVLTMVVVELAVGLGARGLIGGPQAVGWRLGLVQDFGFSPPLWNWMMETGRYAPDNLLRFVSYPFVHGSFTHMLFAAVFTLALGKFVGEVFHPLALAAVWIASAIGGALVYAVVAPDTQIVLYGGMVPAYGLIGAFTFIIWQRQVWQGQSALPAFQLIGFLMAFQLLMGALFGSGSLGWVAELAGFAVGFGLSFFVCPGGWSGALARLRRR